jgi:small subunit ribosomal protein S11
MSDEKVTTQEEIMETPVETGEVEVEKEAVAEAEKISTDAVAEEKEGDKMQTVTVKGKKKKKAAPFLRGGRGQAHIKSSYNNTIISITDLNGSVLCWASAGKCGFKGPKKSTPYAAGIVAKAAVDKIKDLGIKEFDVFIKGVGAGREAAVRAFDTYGIKVMNIKDVTPIQHGGCRPKGRRRV